jgi:hypothetical protein
MYMSNNYYAVSSDSSSVTDQTMQMAVYTIHNNLMTFAIIVSLQLMQDYEEQILNKNKTRIGVRSRKLP